MQQELLVSIQNTSGFRSVLDKLTRPHVLYVLDGCQKKEKKGMGRWLADKVAAAHIM